MDEQRSGTAATELDDNLYGELRASYVFLLRRPVALSAYVRGGTGENKDVTLVSGQGPALLLPRPAESEPWCPTGRRWRGRTGRQQRVPGLHSSPNVLANLS